MTSGLRDSRALAVEVPLRGRRFTLKKILIANRGEIAVRVIRACREMGMSPVAVYSECDRAALHVRYADEAYPIGPSAPRESYLRIDRLIDAARRSGADARAPGLRLPRRERSVRRGRSRCRADLHRSDARGDRDDGQQDRRADWRRSARACRSSRAPRIRSRPTCPTPRSPPIAQSIGYPAAREGRRRRRRQGDAHGHRSRAICRARFARRDRRRAPRSATRAVYLERRLTRPRHIEVQLLGDAHGTVLPFVERECSIQRRHQKVVEETPSLAVSPALRAGDDVGRRGRGAGPSATRTPARSSSCSTRTAASTSSR